MNTQNILEFVTKPLFENKNILKQLKMHFMQSSFVYQKL